MLFRISVAQPGEVPRPSPVRKGVEVLPREAGQNLNTLPPWGGKAARQTASDLSEAKLIAIAKRVIRLLRSDRLLRRIRC